MTSACLTWVKEQHLNDGCRPPQLSECHRPVQTLKASNCFSSRGSDSSFSFVVDTAPPAVSVCYSKKNGTVITGRTPTMSNSALRKARDLSSDVRDALERLLGRALQEEETISVQAYATHEAPTGSERDEAWRRLLERIDKTAARVANVPESELDALIDRPLILSAITRRHEDHARRQHPCTREYARSGTSA